MDALIAAPQHHKLLFENEQVRVLDTFIAPGIAALLVPLHHRVEKWATAKLVKKIKG
jgi:hypothetical protein